MANLQSPARRAGRSARAFISKTGGERRVRPIVVKVQLTRSPAFSCRYPCECEKYAITFPVFERLIGQCITQRVHKLMPPLKRRGMAAYRR
jgi:hypothetical protein